MAHIWYEDMFPIVDFSLIVMVVSKTLACVS